MANEARKIQMAQIKLQKSLQDFVTVMGVEAKKHFVSSFRNQGFTDETLKRWQSRKGEVSGFGVSRRSAGSRAILIGKGSGDLKKSISIKAKSYNSITVGSDLPYAQIHNDGLYGKAWGKYRFKMPKRQFIGHSRKLIDLLRNKLDVRIQNVFK